MKYTVTNTYGIAGESHHRTAKSALKAAEKREGEGWVVIDDEGCQWDFDWEKIPTITRQA